MLDNTPIFLLGFMGAGKTTVGRALACHLNYDFFDLDEVIVERTGKSVQQIFAELGEPEFRRLESEAIRSCRNMINSVIALGGGTYIDEQNRVALRSIGKTIWLDCPLETCLKRIAGDKSRPLLGDEGDMKALFDRRRAAYAQADHSIEVGDLSAEELALRIASLLRR